MAIDGIGNKSSSLAQYLVSTRNNLEDLQLQLSTGKKSQSYAGMGVDRGFAVALRSQLAATSAFKDTITNVDARISVATAALGRMSDLGNSVRRASLDNSVVLDNTGRTTGQQTALSALAEVIQLLNTQAGDRSLFSGRATDTPSVASLNDIMDGKGAAAGLKQVIAERKQADLGSTGLGRLVIGSPSATSVSVDEDVAGSPFGLKLGLVTSTLSGGGSVTGPSGSPPSLTIDLGATNPNQDDQVQLNFTLPDGSSESVTLKATTSNPPPPGTFLIGADTTATAVNLQSALTSAIGNLANGQLVAASAFAASGNFFDNPPLRVPGPAFDAATSLVAGTAADTVQWYTGETGSDPARGTAVVRVDQAISVSYGVRADEEGIRSLVQNLATFAAVSTSPADPNGKTQVNALNQRAALSLSSRVGVQSIEDIEAQLAGAQTSIASAKDRHVQAESMLQSMLDGVEGISTEEVAAKILAMQTNMQASYQTTAMLYQMSLVKYM